MSEVIDINQIAVLMSELIQDYNELARCWYEVFHDPVAKDIQLKFLDTDGVLKTYTIPNRAKDKSYLYHGNGNPEGVVSAATGSIYQDTSNGRLYAKMATSGSSGASNTNWKWIMPLNEIYLSGSEDPDESIFGAVGTLYTNTETGWLFTKTPEGWQQVGATGFAEKTWCEQEFDKLQDTIESAVVHLDYKERIIGEKTFDNIVDSVFNGECTFNSNNTFNGTNTFINDNTFNGVNTFTNNTNFNGVNTFTNNNTFNGANTFNGVNTFTKNNTFKEVTTFEKVIMGTAYRALSADIAEYYEADKDYEPGTLVQFGGDKEVTGAKDMVNAIVSTAPAYILNGGVDMKHPTLLALSGRIPVRVKGKVDKFDLIKLSDEEGVAIVDNSCYNPIGRALEANPNEEEKLVECVVKLNI